MLIRRHVFAVTALSLILVAAGTPASDPGGGVSGPESVGMDPDRLERLTPFLQSYVEDDRIAGSVLHVVRRGKAVYHRAFGRLDVEKSKPMTEDAIFRIASQTKAILSVGIMMLQEEGRLLIGDPVGAYLPEFLKTTVAVPSGDGGYIVVPADRPITIRDLLTHTAGVGYGEGPAADLWEEAGIQGWYFADRDEPIREVVRRMAALPFDAQPGEAFVYGYSTDILGAVIEVVSGMPLDRFLTERILEPLGMNDTHFFLPPSKAGRLAVVYSSAEDGPIVRAPIPGRMVGQGAYVEGPRMCLSGGAGLLSTARDYARFLQMLLAGGRLGDVRLLAPSTVELMTVDHLDDVPFPAHEGMGFGLGFSIVEDLGRFGEPGTVGSFGWGGAYHSTYWVDPGEDLIVVYLTQLIPARDIDDKRKLRALVYQAIVD